MYCTYTLPALPTPLRPTPRAAPTAVTTPRHHVLSPPNLQHRERTSTACPAAYRGAGTPSSAVAVGEGAPAERGASIGADARCATGSSLSELPIVGLCGSPRRNLTDHGHHPRPSNYHIPMKLC